MELIDIQGKVETLPVSFEDLEKGTCLGRWPYAAIMHGPWQFVEGHEDLVAQRFETLIKKWAGACQRTPDNKEGYLIQTPQGQFVVSFWDNRVFVEPIGTISSNRENGKSEFVRAKSSL